MIPGRGYGYGRSIITGGIGSTNFKRLILKMTSYITKIINLDSKI